MIKWLINLFRKEPECRAVQWYEVGHIDSDLAERISRVGFTCKEFTEACKGVAKMGIKI